MMELGKEGTMMAFKEDSMTGTSSSCNPSL